MTAPCTHDGRLYNGEPLIHSQISDTLPEDHPLAWQSVYCTDCLPAHRMLHGVPNENMTTWVETGAGPLCVPHYAARVAADDMGEEVFALKRCADCGAYVPTC